MNLKTAFFDAKDEKVVFSELKCMLGNKRYLRRAGAEA